MEMNNRDWVNLWSIADQLLSNGFVRLDDLDDEERAIIERLTKEI